MNPTTINFAESNPVNESVTLPFPVQGQCGPVALPSPSALRQGTSDLRRTIDLEDGAEVNVANASEADGGESGMLARKQRQPKKRYTCPLDRERNWLADDPSQWQGRRVLRRTTGAVYTIRQAYKSGRVELERNWMTYLTDVTTIRAEYEPYA